MMKWEKSNSKQICLSVTSKSFCPYSIYIIKNVNDDEKFSVYYHDSFSNKPNAYANDIICKKDTERQAKEAGMLDIIKNMKARQREIKDLKEFFDSQISELDDDGIGYPNNETEILDSQISELEDDIEYLDDPYYCDDIID